MGWFALVLVAGFLISVSPLKDKIDTHLQGIALSALALLALLVLMAETPLYNVRWMGRTVDFLTSATMARIVAGGALGYLTPRLFAAPAPSWHLIGAAAALFGFACISPHVDIWMRKLSSFKSSVIEFQLASTATANKAIAVAQNIESHASDLVFKTLKTYDEAIQNDIDFIELVELPKLTKKANAERRASLERAVSAAKAVKPVFEGLIKELSDCIDGQIEAGMNIDRVRSIVQPISIRLQQIVLNDANNDLTDDDQHVKFWNAVVGVPSALHDARLLARPGCSTAGTGYIQKHNDRKDAKAYPRITNSRDFAYLYVPASLLMFLNGETGTALAILERARSRLVYADHKVLTLLGLLRGFRGQPAARVIEPYDEMRQLAVLRQGLATEACAGTCSDKLKKLIAREKFYELLAINNIAGAIADDLARGYHSARDLEATAEAHANRLKDHADKEPDPEAAEPFIDTYAFSLVVIEAQKKNPDKSVFAKMARVLQGLVERIERRVLAKLEKGEQPSRSDTYALSTARLHFNTARELSGD
jgi:hypothetical protein